MKKSLRFLVIVSGVLFILAGAFKFLAPAPGGSTLEGQRAFAQALSGLGVPIPFVMAALIPALEVVGGVGLISGKGRKLWALLLALDMIGAIFLVGLPGKFGRVVSVGESTIGAESWRLPLEIGLLLLMLYVLFLPSAEKAV